MTLAAGLAELLAFVTAVDFVFSGALVVSFAGGATGAGFTPAGLLAGFGTAFFGTSTWAGMAEAGETCDGGFAGESFAAFTGGSGAGWGG